MAGTESTLVELQTFLDDNFVSDTGDFKMTTLKEYLENLNASINIALQQSYNFLLKENVVEAVVFPTPFSAGSTYQLTWWAFDSTGNRVQVEITNMNENGFNAEAVVAATLHYVANKNN